MRLRAILLLSFFFASGACSLVPASGGGMHGGLGRGPANALPEKRVFPVSLQEGMKSISGGADFEITCTGKSAKAQSADVTVEVFTAGSDDTRMFKTTISEFSRELSQLGSRTVVSANHSYLTARDSLYYQNTQGSVRIYDPQAAMYETCRRLGDATAYSFVFHNRPLSLVGPYASYETVTKGYGDGHPWAAVTFQAVNADNAETSPKNRSPAKAGRAKLNELLDNASLVKALKKDPFLQKRAGNGLLGARTLTAVHAQLRQRTKGCDIAMPEKLEEWMSNFAIFDYPADGENVAVRLAFGYGCEAMRGNLTQISLVAKPQAAFKALLDAERQAARATGRQPYFMKYLLHGSL